MTDRMKRKPEFGTVDYYMTEAKRLRVRALLADSRTEREYLLRRAGYLETIAFNSMRHRAESITNQIYYS